MGYGGRESGRGCGSPGGSPSKRRGALGRETLAQPGRIRVHRTRLQGEGTPPPVSAKRSQFLEMIVFLYVVVPHLFEWRIEMIYQFVSFCRYGFVSGGVRRVA